MKKKILDQILEKCNKLYKNEQDEMEKDEEVEEKCSKVKECQCEQDLQEAFFGVNYK